MPTGVTLFINGDYQVAPVKITTTNVAVVFPDHYSDIATEGLKPVRLHTQGDDFFKETYFLRRGDPDQKEGIAPVGFLQILTAGPEQEKRWQAAPPSGWRTSYRRRALAKQRSARR